MPTGQAWLKALVDSAAPSVLGFAFWIVAARRFPAANVGRAAVLVVVLIALSEAARLLMGRGLRRIPAWQRPLGLARSPEAYGVVAVLGAFGALLFMAGLDLWAPGLLPLRQSGWVFALVVLGSAAWAAFRLQVTALASEEQAPWAPVEHAALSVARLLLLLPLAGVAETHGVVLAWIIPAPLVVVLIAVAERQLPWFGPGTKPRLSPHRAGSATSWLRGSVLARSVTVSAVLLIVLGIEGPEAAAYVFAAWLIADSAHRLAGFLGRTVAAQPVPDGYRADEYRLARTIGNMLMILPVAAVIVIIAPWLLTTFGVEYRDAASGLLRLLVAAVVATVALRGLTARMAADGKAAAVVAIEGAAAVALIATTWLLVAAFGLPGLGLAWVLVLVLLGAAALLGQSIWWWAPRLVGSTAHFASALSGFWVRLRSLHNRPALNRQVTETLRRLYKTVPDWSRVSSSGDSQVVTVAGHEGRPPLRIEFARSQVGADALINRVSAVSAINQTEGILGLRTVVPFPIEHAREGTEKYLIESDVSGQPGTAPSDPNLHQERLDAVVTAISELHDATGVRRVIDRADLDKWVTRPLRHLDDACRLVDIDLVGLGRLLFEGLEGEEVCIARLNGNLRLDKTLFEPDRPRLTGVLGWEWSEMGPVAVDWGVLTLSSLATEERNEVGMIVERLLGEPDCFVDHPAFVAAPGRQSPHALLLLAWLHHIKPELVEAAERGVGDYWIARNVQPVLDRLEALSLHAS